MPSYLVGQLKDFSYDEKQILQTVQNLSAKEDSKDLRTGTLPKSFHADENGCRFKYAREELEESGGLEEDAEVKTVKEYSIVIKKSGHVMLEIANCTKAVRREIIGFVQGNFANSFAVEPVNFGDEELRRMEKDAANLYELGVYPRSPGEVDEVKMLDRDDVRGKNVHLEYSMEPWAKIKVGLERRDIDRKIGLSQSGRLTIYGRDLEPSSELEILSATIRELRPLANQKSYQKTMEGQTAE